MSPNPVVFKIGSNTETFTLSAAQVTPIGQYYLTWSLQDTDHEEINTFFAPVKRSYFTLEDAKDETITIEDAGLIPRGGVSPPLKVTLSTPCSSSLTLSFTVLGSSPTEVSFSAESLTFLSGDQEKIFTIAIPSTSTGAEGQYVVTVSGDNAESYTLSSNILDFTVADADITPPVAISFAATEIGRNEALFVLGISERVTVYYVIALQGTDQPSFAEAKQGFLDPAKAANLAMLPMFGYTTTGTELEDGTVEYSLDI